MSLSGSSIIVAAVTVALAPPDATSTVLGRDTGSFAGRDSLQYLDFMCDGHFGHCFRWNTILVPLSATVQ